MPEFEGGGDSTTVVGTVTANQGAPNTPANAWPVVITGGSGFATFAHNEITSVASSVETSIIDILVGLSGLAVMRVEASGTNVALFRVKVSGATQVDKRSWWADFNVSFDFTPDGLLVPAGSLLSVTVLHTRPLLGDFEATVMGN